MARKHGIEGSNSNMVVREVLETNGIDLSKFTNNFFDPMKIRRKYEKMPVCTMETEF